MQKKRKEDANLKRSSIAITLAFSRDVIEHPDVSPRDDPV